MARRKTSVRISLHGVSSPTTRLNLVLDCFGDHWHVYRDGVISKSFPLASSTVIAKQLQKWLIVQSKILRESRSERTTQQREPARAY